MEEPQSHYRPSCIWKPLIWFVLVRPTISTHNGSLLFVEAKCPSDGHVVRMCFLRLLNNVHRVPLPLLVLLIDPMPVLQSSPSEDSMSLCVMAALQVIEDSHSLPKQFLRLLSYVMTSDPFQPDRMLNRQNPWRQGTVFIVHVERCVDIEVLSFLKNIFKIYVYSIL